MIEATTRIYIRDPEREDNLIPGVVNETLGEKIVVRFLQPISLQQGFEMELLYHNQQNCFTRVKCQLQRMFSRGQYPTGAVVLTSEPEVAENRASYRVSINDGLVAAVINTEDKGEVINVSSGGVAVLLDTDEYRVDQWLNIGLHYDCDEHRGRMQVRGVFRQDDGRFRYGLMVDPEEADMVSQLTRITQEIQQVKARRASRIGVNNKAARKVAYTDAETPEDTSATTEAEGESNEASESDAHANSQRKHKRNPWPGMAKVYIREDHNLRVLDVETGDLSRGGISFLCHQYIYKDSETLFEKPVSDGFFRVVVVVCNVMMQQKGMHRIGAKFVGVPLRPGEMPPEFDPSKHAA